MVSQILLSVLLIKRYIYFSPSASVDHMPFALIVAAHAKCGNEVVNEPLPQFMTAAMLRQPPPAKILIMT